MPAKNSKKNIDPTFLDDSFPSIVQKCHKNIFNFFSRSAVDDLGAEICPIILCFGKTQACNDNSNSIFTNVSFGNKTSDIRSHIV